MTISLRPATPSDAPAISRIQRLGWESTYINDAVGITREKMTALLANTEERIEKTRQTIADITWTKDGLWVAEDNGTVVGFVRPRMDDRGRHRVGALYVLPEAQGKGVGSLLLEKVKEFFHDHPISLEVATYNHRARRFYEQHGFQATGHLSEIETKKDGVRFFAIPVEEMVWKAPTE